MTPDGTRVVVLELSTKTDTFDLAVLTLDGEPVMEPLLDTGFFVNRPHLTPDGRWMAYESSESGTDEIYVRPFPDVDEGRWQISNGGGIDPIWGPGGRELFFRTLEGHLMRAAIETEPEFVAGNPEIILEPGLYVVSSFNRSFDISPDGQRFLMMKDARSTDDDPYAGLTQMIIVQNWFQELNARVPVE